MSLIENIEQIISRFVNGFKKIVFGENNSHIDEILDYFYSIRQEKRTKIVVYSIGSSTAIVILIFGLYFFGLYNQQKNLNLSVANLVELKKIKSSYTAIQERFVSETKSMQANTLSGVVSFLNEKATLFSLQTTPIPPKPPLIDLPGSNPLSNQYKKARIDFKISNISLKRTMDFVNEIHKSPGKFKVTKLDIQQIYGTKLYFDVGLTVDALVISANAS